MDKKRIVKDYENLPEEVINQIKVSYPGGYADHLVSFTNKEGKRVSALPFETADIYYLIRMTIMEAHQIIEDDEDYDDDGTLRDDFSLEDAEEEEIVESSDDDDDDPSSKKRHGHNDAYTMDDVDDEDDDED